MSISSGQINAGSSVTLTCTVELNSVIDVPVTVNTVWSGPAGFTTEDSGLVQPVVGNTATFTSTATVRSFGRNQSGDYMCTGTVISSPSNLFLMDSMSQSGTTTVTVGETLVHCFI